MIAMPIEEPTAFSRYLGSGESLGSRPVWRGGEAFDEYVVSLSHQDVPELRLNQNAVTALRHAEAIDAVAQALFGAIASSDAAVRPATLQNAIAFLAELPRCALDAHVVVEDDGEIAFDWFEDRFHTLSVSIGTATAGYSALIGQESVYGRVPLADPLPDTLAEVLSKVLRTTAKAGG